jgi:outer membrane protein OmpA-like peptidoglycan-associated protein
MVVVKKDRIEIKQQIKFGSGSAKIIGAPSFEVIREVAQALRDNPQIKKIRIEGHTDSVGGDATNLKLSQRRADAVMSAMIKEGVDPGRMEAVGFGETKPISSNATATGRGENRRTEFNIIEQ